MSTSHNAFLPPDLRELIEADRHAADPSEDVRQDVARRVDRALGLGGAMLIPAPSAISKWDVAPQAGSAIAPAAAGIAAWKIAVGIAVVALAGGGGLSLAGRHTSSPPIHVQTTTSLELATAPKTAPESSPVRALPPGSSGDIAQSSVSLDLDALPETTASSKVQSPERARPVRTSDRLADERRLLDRARSSLVRRDAAEALSALRSHEKAFPRGQLVEEREGMRVQALVLAHDFGSARTAGERFRKAYARSVFLPVVDRALESAR
jgi:hypothetical protein